MKKVQKFKAVFEEGKETSKEKIGKARSFMDSVADNCLMNSESLIKKTKENKKVKETIEYFAEVKQPKKAATKAE